MKRFELEDDQLFELSKPLDGLCDAEAYWGHTVEDLYIDGLGMKSLYDDAAIYVKSGKNGAEGFSGICVDDSLNAGFEIFQNSAKKTTAKFECKPGAYDNFDFFGTQFKTVACGSFSKS